MKRNAKAPRKLQCLVTLILALQTVPTAAQTLGMVVDPTTNSVIVFDADADTVLTTFPVPGDLLGDCSITPDQAFGFVTNFSSVVTVIDLNALALLPGIPISNRGLDTSITPAGDCLVLCDGTGVVNPISAVGVNSMTEVSTLALPSHCTSVDVCSDGATVLATSISPRLVHRLTIGPGPMCTLTDTGDTITTGGYPENVTCAPDSGSLVAIPGSIRSFTTPPLAGPVSIVSLTGPRGGMSAAFNPPGTVIYARSEGGSVDAFTYNPATGAVGPSIGGAFPLAIADTICCPFGVEQMALHPNGTKLYVSQPGSLDVFDATTGAALTSIVDASISLPTGVCFSPTSISGVAATIEIRHGSNPNSINCSHNGVIPVAILTTSTAAGEPVDFDATTVDSSTVTFGPDKAGPTHRRAHIKDVDSDGDMDMVLHFRQGSTGIQCGDVEACLTGQTSDGTPIEGCDAIRTVGG